MPFNTGTAEHSRERQGLNVRLWMREGFEGQIEETHFADKGPRVMTRKDNQKSEKKTPKEWTGLYGSTGHHGIMRKDRGCGLRCETQHDQ
jgi:hypothetical protein